MLDELHGTGLPRKGTYGKPDWLDSVRSEYWACREGVCLIDMSTFAKFELRVSESYQYIIYFESEAPTIQACVVLYNLQLLDKVDDGEL